ncbi:MAG: hypothetical protein Q8Q09_18070 [Deltaproteobacteria bacterium]|nr:hypothetical protein [Deltaproteobacteria bacterium]
MQLKIGPRWPHAFATLAITALALSGCARRAQLDVLRPAMLNAAAHGYSYEVRNFDGNPSATSEVIATLRTAISTSLNPAIVLVNQQGGLVIEGGVGEYFYTEQESRDNATCSHQEGSGSSRRTVQHACTRIVRVGRASARVDFRVTATSSNQVVYARSFANTAERRATWQVGPYPADNTVPVAIDPNRVLSEALQGAVQPFMHVILPWRDSIELEFEGCGGDARCNQGFEAVQARDLVSAERLFSAVVGSTPPSNAGEIERVSDALYNRAQVRMLQGVYGGAFVDLQQALQLRPTREQWRTRYSQLEQLAQDQAALRAQHGLESDDTPPTSEVPPPVNAPTPSPTQ